MVVHDLELHQYLRLVIKHILPRAAAASLRLAPLRFPIKVYINAVHLGGRRSFFPSLTSSFFWCFCFLPPPRLVTAQRSFLARERIGPADALTDFIYNANASTEKSNLTFSIVCWRFLLRPAVVDVCCFLTRRIASSKLQQPVQSVRDREGAPAMKGHRLLSSGPARVFPPTIETLVGELGLSAVTGSLFIT